MKNRYVTITRDWKGMYSKEDMRSLRGYHLVGGEEEIQDGSDGQSMVFSLNPTKLNVEKIFAIRNKLEDAGLDLATYKGFRLEKYQGDPIIEE